MDLRSNEERALFPNRWIETDPSIDYRYVDYSMMDMLARFQGEQRERPGMGELYRYLPAQITAQLKLYFSALLQSRTPIVVNCSAGQDRTGLSAALLLSALGVSRELVIEDYLLSTDFRRPDREKGDVDLEAAAASNAFARMMLSYHQPGSIERANPLVTEQGVPFIVFALDQIETDYGSVEGYLEQALGVSADDLGSLRSLYLVDHPH